MALHGDRAHDPAHDGAAASDDRGERQPRSLRATPARRGVLGGAHARPEFLRRGPPRCKTLQRGAVAWPEGRRRGAARAPRTRSAAGPRAAAGGRGLAVSTLMRQPKRETAMAPIFTIIAPGAMGSAVAHRMRERGATVRTSLAGRSVASARRAAECGMTDVASDRELVEGVDIVLSIVPPGEATALAARLKPVLSAVARKPLVIDCNALNPATVAEIASLLAPSGAPF